MMPLRVANPICVADYRGPKRTFPLSLPTSSQSRIVSNSARRSLRVSRKSLSEYDFSMAISEEGRGPQDFHPENARDGVKPQREAFDYASFCSIL